MLPTTFSNSRYHLLQVLGQGGMGIVHQALDRLTGETVALKRVTAAHKVRAFAIATAEQTPDALQLALTREFQVLASLRHPHIISVLDYGFDAEQQPFYTMNYLPEAQTLLEAGHRRSQPEKLNLIAQVLQALIYLHRRGVLHRDLKPENILVSAGVVQVLDFGLAASGGEAGAGSGSEGGTAQYAAPELWDGQPYTVRADLFALGIILAQLLTGHHPFGPLDQMFIERVLDEPPDLTGTEPALAKLLHRLLAKTPAERLASAEETLAAVMDAIGQPLPPETTAIRESFLQTATFVGREAEMLALTTALREAAAGRGSGWLIGGESGVGKTRLISELRTQALVSGFQVLQGQMVEGGGLTLTYQLWREPLRHLLVSLPQVDELTASVLLPLVPDISHLLGRPVTSAPMLDEIDAQTRLLVTITQLFWQAQQPVLLVLEDLHWAEESLLPIPYLARLIADQRLLLIGSYRHDERPHLPTQLPDLQVLTLPRLTPDNIAELSTAMLGEAGKHPAVLALLQRETEGNAFFAVEVVRELAVQAGRLGGIGQMALPETLLPNGIQDIVNRRLERLSPAERDLLAMAAVAGRELELPLIKHLAGAMEVENVWLPRCAEVAVLEIQQGQWQFQHAKLREGLLAQQPAAHLPARHQRVAEAIEQLHPNEADQAARLVHHWHEAGQTEKELTYALKAGQQAAAQYAHREALRFFDRALELLPATAELSRYEVLLSRFKTLDALGEHALQTELLPHLTALAQHLNDVAKRIEVLVLHAEFAFDQGSMDQAEDLYQQAYELMEAMGDKRQQAQLLAKWVGLLTIRRKLDLALEKAQHSQALFQVLGEPAPEAYVALGSVLSHMGQMREAIANGEKGLALYQQTNNEEGVGGILFEFGTRYHMAGEYDLAQAYYSQALTIVRKMGKVRRELILLNNMGWQNTRLGAYALAIEQLQRCIALGQLINAPIEVSYARNNLAAAFHKKGDFEQAQAHFRQTLTAKQALNHPWSEAFTWNLFGYLQCDMGALTEAQAAYQQAETLQQKVSFTPTLVETWAGLARVALQQNNLPLAQTLAEKVWGHISDNGFEDKWQWEISGLTLHSIFQATADARAAEILRMLFDTVQHRANQIKDAALRASFLQNPPEHREIVRRFETQSKAPI